MNNLYYIFESQTNTHKPHEPPLVRLKSTHKSIDSAVDDFIESAGFFENYNKISTKYKYHAYIYKDGPGILKRS